MATRENNDQGTVEITPSGQNASDLLNFRGKKNLRPLGNFFSTFYSGHKATSLKMLTFFFFFSFSS